MRRIAIAFLAFIVLSCVDPVRSAEQDALGPEDPSVPRGELHRPGQPCLVCHDGFSLAGTVYNEDLVTPFEGATITLTDSTGSQTTATTNAAGNFIVRKSDWTPVYPIGTYTASDGTNVVGVSIVGTDPNNTAQMITQLGREGSCNACHLASGTAPNSPGPIYITTGGTP